MSIGFTIHWFLSRILEFSGFFLYFISMKPFEMFSPIPLQSDKPHDHCGVFGIFGHPQAAQMTFYGLQALQHLADRKVPGSSHPALMKKPE